jgi:hypothetical protein
MWTPNALTKLSEINIGDHIETEIIVSEESS